VQAYDALVIGAGPAGSSTATYLARAGARVLLVDKARFPRDKPCGGGLTGRALKRIPVDPSPVVERDVDRFELRLRYGPRFARTHDEPLIRMTQRRQLDAFLADHAAAAGADLRDGVHVEAVEIDDSGVTARIGGDGVRADVLVGADGANGLVARRIGVGETIVRGVALEGNVPLERLRVASVERTAVIELAVVPGGYGWVFPVGDGTVNIGVGLLSTFRDFKSVNTTHLLDSYARMVADRWEIDPDQPTCKPTSGRIPMGGSVGPNKGPTYLVVGDAAGSVNPFNGEGIDYAYETGRLAADTIHEALVSGDPLVLSAYPRQVQAEYGQYFKVARLFARIIGHPTLMRELTRVGMHSRTLMEWVLRIMANLLRPDEVGPAEAAYRAAAALARFAPDA